MNKCMENYSKTFSYISEWNFFLKFFRNKFSRVIAFMIPYKINFVSLKFGFLIFLFLFFFDVPHLATFIFVNFHWFVCNS
jgi:hypothetical protein